MCGDGLQGEGEGAVLLVVRTNQNPVRTAFIPSEEGNPRDSHQAHLLKAPPPRYRHTMRSKPQPDLARGFAGGRRGGCLWGDDHCVSTSSSVVPAALFLPRLGEGQPGPERWCELPRDLRAFITHEVTGATICLHA